MASTQQLLQTEAEAEPKTNYFLIGGVLGALILLIGFAVYYFSLKESISESNPDSVEEETSSSDNPVDESTGYDDYSTGYDDYSTEDVSKNVNSYEIEGGVSYDENSNLESTTETYYENETTEEELTFEETNVSSQNSTTYETEVEMEVDDDAVEEVEPEEEVVETEVEEEVEEPEEEPEIGLTNTQVEDIVKQRLQEKMGHPNYRNYAKSRVTGAMSGPRGMVIGTCSRTGGNCQQLDAGAADNVKNQINGLVAEGAITQAHADILITNLFEVEVSDSLVNQVEDIVRQRLQQRMGHPNYRKYARDRVDGAMSGPRPMTIGTCSRTGGNCQQINGGAANNVKNQINGLVAEGAITQADADILLTNLNLS